jgi:hypothetical protein
MQTPSSRQGGRGRGIGASKSSKVGLLPGELSAAGLIVALSAPFGGAMYMTDRHDPSQR